MQLIDTHCHIHSTDYKLDREIAYKNAIDAGVSKLICVGTDVADSKLAVQFANDHPAAFASVGVHPHEAKHGLDGLKDLITQNKIVAIGEIGLDYFYNHSDRQTQIDIFEAQLQIASDADLPVIFHVREAFDDFWPIIDKFSGIKGVLHSFTDSQENAEKALERGLYVGVNGIATFTKDEAQKQMYANLPLEKIILETDSPYLTPVPHRGIVNEPAFMTHVAHHLANLQAINLEELSRATERNATKLFFT